MLHPSKSQSVLQWFNSLTTKDSIQSITHFTDGSRFYDIVNSICTYGRVENEPLLVSSSPGSVPMEEENSGTSNSEKGKEKVTETETDSTLTEEEIQKNYDAIEKFIDEFFQLESKSLVSYIECKQGKDLELAKVAVLLLSAMVQSFLSMKNQLIYTTTLLDPQVQEDIKELLCLTLPIEGEPPRRAEFHRILGRPAKYKGSPRRRAPSRGALIPTVTPELLKTIPQKRKDKVATIPEEIIESPLKCLLESPQIQQRAALFKKDAELSKQRNALHMEEMKVLDLTSEKEILNDELEKKKRELEYIKDESRKFRELVDEREAAKQKEVEELLAERENNVQAIVNHKEEITELKKENDDLLNRIANLDDMLEQVSKPIPRDAGELQELKDSVKNKDLIIADLSEKNKAIETDIKLYQDLIAEMTSLRTPRRLIGDSGQMQSPTFPEIMSSILASDENAKLMEKDAECSRLTSRILTEVAKSEQLEKNVSDAEIALASSKLNIQGLQIRMSSLLQDLDEARMEIDTLKRMIRSCVCKQQVQATAANLSDLKSDVIVQPTLCSTDTIQPASLSTGAIPSTSYNMDVDRTTSCTVDVNQTTSNVIDAIQSNSHSMQTTHTTSSSVETQTEGQFHALSAKPGSKDINFDSSREVGRLWDIPQGAGRVIETRRRKPSISMEAKGSTEIFDTGSIYSCREIEFLNIAKLARSIVKQMRQNCNITEMKLLVSLEETAKGLISVGQIVNLLQCIIDCLKSMKAATQFKTPPEKRTKRSMTSEDGEQQKIEMQEKNKFKKEIEDMQLQLKKQHDEYKTQLKVKEDELNSSKNICEKLQTMCNKLHEDTQVKMAELKIANSRFEDVKVQFKLLNAENRQLVAAVNRLETKAAKIKAAEIKALPPCTKCELLYKKLSDVKQDRKMLELNIADLKAIVKDAQGSNLALQRQVEVETKERKRLEFQIQRDNAFMFGNLADRNAVIHHYFKNGMDKTIKAEKQAAEKSIQKPPLLNVNTYIIQPEKNNLYGETSVSSAFGNKSIRSGFLQTDDEEDFLNHSSLAEIQRDTHSRNAPHSEQRLQELKRRNTLCLPHLQSSYPLEMNVTPTEKKYYTLNQLQLRAECETEKNFYGDQQPDFLDRECDNSQDSGHLRLLKKRKVEKDEHTSKKVLYAPSRSSVLRKGTSVTPIRRGKVFKTPSSIHRLIKMQHKNKQ